MRVFVTGATGFPRVSEQTALALLSQKVCASVMRLPQVHDTQ
jgi:hypothetical protein